MENVLSWIEIIIAILTGLAAAIPLVVALIKYILTLFKEKKWNELVKMALGYMTEAEQKYSDGADKKALVMAMIRTSAQQIGYELDAESEAKMSNLVDQICEASKILNKKPTEEKVVEESIKK